MIRPFGPGRTAECFRRTSENTAISEFQTAMREAMPHAHLPVCEHPRGAARNPCDPACRSAWIAAQLPCMYFRPARRASYGPVVASSGEGYCLSALTRRSKLGWVIAPVVTDSLISREERLSRPAEFHHRPLAEPSVRLSPHSAPIGQTCRPYGLSVARIEVLLFPVASVMRPPDPTPSLQLRYEPSSLLRVGPPQCSASVRSPRGFGRLGFSLPIRATGSCSSAQQPASASRPTPVAVRTAIRHPADWSQAGFTLLVSTTLGFLTTRLRRVHFRSSLGCSPARVSSRAFTPTLTTTAFYRSSLDQFAICS